jgi:hypothetical protein
MNASTAFLLLLVLACPLMMMWMMRGGHGHRQGSDHHSGHHHDDNVHTPLMRERSTKGLRELRDEIDQMIDERERGELEQSERETPVGSWR